MEDKNTKPMFTNISYSKKQSADPSFDEYRVGFTYKNKEMAYFIFAPKSRHLTEAEAKKQFEALIKSGELKKYADHYDNDNNRRKKVLVPIVALLTAGAIAGATIGTYFALNQPSTPKVDVIIPETNGLVFSNIKAYKGQDYDTNISVNKTLTDALLPDNLTKVTSGNREITNTEYTYSVADNKETATLHIPGQYIEDTITITLTLVEPIVKHTLTFNGTNCDLYLDAEGKTKYTKTDFEAGYSFSGYIIAEEGYALPSNVVFTSGGQPYKDDTATYDSTSGALSLKMNADIDVAATCIEWFADNNYLANLTEDDIIKENPDGSIGEINTVKVNGQIHKVRLIGVDHDELADGSSDTAHTTWEFVNLISDEDGHSLALTYDDNDATNFINSHLRKALDGKGDYANDIRWYQKDEDEETTPSEEYKNKSVIDMLPVNLVNNMKAVTKKVVKDGGYEDQQRTPPTTTTYDTKLFVLSKEEYFSSLQEEASGEIILKDEGDTYSFYSNLDDNTITYIHKQVDGEDICDKHSVDNDGDIWTYAGYNLAADNTGGGRFWMRSPYHLNKAGYYPYNAFMMEAEAEEETELFPKHMWDRSDVSIEAYAVAPAFCI